MAYQPIANPLPTNQTQVGSTNVNSFPAGFQRTTDEPHQIFYDPFDAALDTKDRWATPVRSGDATAPVIAAGTMTLGSGVAVNSYSQLTSKGTFVPTVPSWLGNSWAIQIEAGATAGTNAVRFWGLGIVGGIPTSTNPLGPTGDGYGFEIDTAGVLQAVVYAGGTRTVVASLATFQPTDGAYHRYICFYRTDRIFWYVDGLGSTQLAATSNFQSPQVQSLPLLALSVAHSSAPAASREIKCTGLAVWDTGKNNLTLSDGAFPWRKATISEAGEQLVKGAVTHAGPIQFPQGNGVTPGILELLTDISTSNRVTIHLLTQILAVSRGRTDPFPSEEVDALLAEFSDPRNRSTLN